MSGKQTNLEVNTAVPEVKRLRASGPILILAVLFVVGAFLTWYSPGSVAICPTRTFPVSG